jgi:hypothetical protein
VPFARIVRHKNASLPDFKRVTQAAAKLQTDRYGGGRSSKRMTGSSNAVPCRATKTSRTGFRSAMFSLFVRLSHDLGGSTAIDRPSDSAIKPKA